MENDILVSKYMKYGDFCDDCNQKKKWFVKEPNFKLNNVFVFQEKIKEFNQCRYFQIPMVFQINEIKTKRMKKNIISRISYSAPIKLFYMIDEDDHKLKVSDIMNKMLLKTFPRAIVTRIGLENVTFRHSASKEKYQSNSRMFVFIFNSVYFLDLRNLYLFMEKFLYECGPKVPCSKKILGNFKDFYGLPIFYNGCPDFFDLDNNFTCIEDCILQFIKPEKKILVHKYNTVRM